MPSPVPNKSALLLALLIPVANSSVLAAFEYPTGSVASFAMVGSVNLQHPSPLDLYVNPALLPPGRVGIELSLSRLYGLPDFDLTSGIAALNLMPLSLALGTTQLAGASYYGEKSYLIAASASLLRQLRVGVSANYLRVEFAESYSDLDLIAFNVGSIWNITAKVAAAVSWHNANQPRFQSTLQSLPSFVNASISYIFSDQSSVFVGHRFEEKAPDRFFLGQQIAIHRKMTLSMGIGTEPTELGAGFSLSFSPFFFDYGFRDNVYLGGTHRIGVRYIKE